MAKTVSLFLLAILVFPSAAEAAWWKPSTWKAFQKETTSEAVLGSASTTDEVIVATPTVSDLYKRIAELEDKLQEAQKKLRAAGVKEVEEKKVEPAAKPASAAGSASDKEVLAKVKQSLVVVETATTSSSGVIIDAEGRILVPAYGVWIEGADKSVTGVVEDVTVILSNGSRKAARLVGLDEARGAAVVKISEKGTYRPIELGSQSTAKQGDRVYVAGMPSTKGGSGGEPFLSGVVSRAGSDSIEVAVDRKPLDNGGAIFDRSGAFIGIPDKSSCKVLEEMKTCLKYSVTSSSLRSTLSQITAGMRLYKDKRFRTPDEALVRGQIDAIFDGTRNSAAIDYAIAISSGKNSFDSFNSRLAGDQDGKVTKLYLNKLKIAAQGLYGAMDFLKSQAHAFNVFVVNEERSIEALGDYQKKTLRELAARSALKEKEYEAKVSLWSRKKNEYDSYLANPADASHNYLLEQGVVIEDELEYLMKEKGAILDAYSGVTSEIF
ncbi:MAG: trypsin-like peptidase domain-containing protein [Candidatus Taylorbacteria bacterium]|nr:trypsin-like peptidase domain-containing protein [Candidatus Taylorbacteria bacterium]